MLKKTFTIYVYILKQRAEKLDRIEERVGAVCFVNSVYSTNFLAPMSNPNCKWLLMTLIYFDN